MIDYGSIYTQMIKVASDNVGSDLSSTNGIPSIIRARVKKNYPQYPYVTVDIQDVTERAGFQQYEYINDNDNTVHCVNKTLMISYRVYGGVSSSANEDLAISIAERIHGAFAFHTTRDNLRGSLGAAVGLLNEVRNEPVLLSDKYIESASFFVLIDVIDENIDLNSTIIETVELEGEVEGQQGDLLETITITIDQP